MGPGPTGAVGDIIMRGMQALTVGDDGMLLSSEDSGVTWQTESSPAVGTVTCVALASDGTDVAGSGTGEIPIRTTS